MKAAIIDKSPVMMEGTGHLLKNHYDVEALWQGPNFATLREKHPDAEPDLIVMGMNKILHDTNLASIQAVKARYPDACLVVFDEKASLSIVLDYLRAGAQGYMPYSIGPDEFRDCIRKVTNGKLFVPAELLPSMIGEKEAVAQRRSVPRLTQREKHIAGLLGNDKKASEIAKSLGVKAATIFATKRIIFRKLKIDTLFQLKEACHELMPEPAGA